MAKSDNLVWIDLEMSGLDPESDVILEIATIVTGPSLKIIAEGPNLVIHQPESVIEAMDEWNTTHHGESGLIEKVRESDLSVGEVEKQTLEFVQNYTEEESAPLCGNTITQDRRFLYRYMPQLSSWLHYRNVDVSSIKELVARWYPEEMHAPTKPSEHRALDDIRGSIEELRWYRDYIFVGQY
ncbi:MAG: oligoribonuclease [Persicimonas sp.]